MSTKRKWSDLTTPQQVAIVAFGAAELVVTAVSAADLARQPAEQVRGPKWAWAVGFIVQPFGPIAYLAWGTKPAPGVER